MRIHWKTKLLTTLAAVLLSACAPSPHVRMESTQALARHERLGTGWGDEVDSRVSRVNLQRLSSTPMDEVVVRYADKAYQGRRINSIALAAGRIELSVHSDHRPLPLVRNGDNYYLQGKAGSAYQLVYRNRSHRTYEIVASVDGLNVINGQRASRHSGGYVLYPHGSLVIEGFRKSDSAVASFIFSKPANSYAANSLATTAANTGIIGTVVYELHNPSQRHLPQRLGRHAAQDSLNAFPADDNNADYAPPPRGTGRQVIQ